jgi:HemY protein
LLRENAEDPLTLEQFWATVPSADRAAPELALEAARRFRQHGREESAAQLLEHALQEHWNERLLDEYARCVPLPVTSALARLEKGMQVHGRSAAALRCLGRLCLRAQLWGKARSYLEESQRLQDDPQTVLALAELAEAVGDDSLAAQRFRLAAQGMARRDNEPAPIRLRWFRREPTI